MNYYLANTESEALKFEPILNKEFLTMEMTFKFVPSITSQNTAWWFGTGKYAKKNIDYSRVTKALSPCK